MCGLFLVLQNYINDRRGVAFSEFALIFPILFVLLFGVFDMGNAILVNQKTISSSQIIADLITRQIDVTDIELDEALAAGKLAMQPFSTAPYGVEVMSIGFTGDGDFDVLWRETRNMPEMPMDEIGMRIAELHQEEEGVVMVAVRYTYRPAFASFVVKEIDMQEISFARGRRTPVVTRTN